MNLFTNNQSWRGGTVPARAGQQGRGLKGSSPCGRARGRGPAHTGHHGASWGSSAGLGHGTNGTAVTGAHTFCPFSVPRQAPREAHCSRFSQASRPAVAGPREEARPPPRCPSPRPPALCLRRPRRARDEGQESALLETGSPTPKMQIAIPLVTQRWDPRAEGPPGPLAVPAGAASDEPGPTSWGCARVGRSGRRHRLLRVLREPSLGEELSCWLCMFQAYCLHF